jgi:hypothetical protein
LRRNKMKPLCIYHGNCADGFGAAWVVWKHFKGKVDFFPGVYQRPPPDVTGRHVLMVDFSYKRPVLQQMANQAKSILILDHHATAKKDLEPDPLHDVFKVNDDADWGTFSQQLEDWGPDDRGTYALFDLDRSGAGITWDFFNPGVPRPKILNHIEDRDLWRFKLDNTREIQASMFSLPYDFEVWDERIDTFEDDGEVRRQTIHEGEAIERKQSKDISELIEVVTRPMRFRIMDGSKVTVPIANLPYIFTADAGHILCERSFFGFEKPSGFRDEQLVGGKFKHPFAGCYWDKPDGRQFSLRSREGGADVGQIATLYGGGGHEHASGFLVAYSQIAQFDP